MKSLENLDERVLMQKRKVQSDTFQLLIYFLLISLLVQKFFFNAPLSQIIVELIGVVGSAFYVEIHNLFLGNNAYSSNNITKKKIIKDSVISSLISTVLLVVLAGITDIQILLILFLACIIFFGSASFLLYYLNIKKQKKIEEELNKDEYDIE